MQGQAIIFCRGCGASVSLIPFDTADDPEELARNSFKDLLDHRPYCWPWRAQQWDRWVKGVQGDTDELPF